VKIPPFCQQSISYFCHQKHPFEFSFKLDLESDILIKSDTVRKYEVLGAGQGLDFKKPVFGTQGQAGVLCEVFLSV
jgi:hypothetical protein